jgi:hypothetical protein
MMKLTTAQEINARIDHYNNEAFEVLMGSLLGGNTKVTKATNDNYRQPRQLDLFEDVAVAGKGELS